MNPADDHTAPIHTALRLPATNTTPPAAFTRMLRKHLAITKQRRMMRAHPSHMKVGDRQYVLVPKRGVPRVAEQRVYVYMSCNVDPEYIQKYDVPVTFEIAVLVAIYCKALKANRPTLELDPAKCTVVINGVSMHSSARDFTVLCQSCVAVVKLQFGKTE